jgi:hypothetical protein
MTFTPTAPFGTGGSVNATIDLTVANSGATNFPNSPNFSNGKTSTAVFQQTLNVSNIGKPVPPSPRP